MMSNEDLHYKGQPLISGVSSYRLREAIGTVKDSCLIDTEREYLTKLEESIS